MSLYNKLYKHLSTSVLITAHTSNRIHPVVLPQGTVAAFPAVTYQRVSGDRVYSLSGYSTLENARLQIDCWATSFETVKDLGDKMRQVVDFVDFSIHCLLNILDIEEVETPTCRATSAKEMPWFSTRSCAR